MSIFGMAWLLAGAQPKAPPMTAIDAIELTRALIRRPSVTPRDEGALDLVQAALEPLGFACRRLPFGEVDNLYARRGAAGPNLCFAATRRGARGRRGGVDLPAVRGGPGRRVLHGRGRRT